MITNPDYAALDETLRAILRDNLEARFVLCEMRRGMHTFLINSPLATPESRARDIRLRDAALVEWGTVMTELEALKAS